MRIFRGYGGTVIITGKPKYGRYTAFIGINVKSKSRCFTP